ncbi:exported hypothetical protein [Actinacidiphila bryophytorum]|uniref:Uncharacterized protein n=1 Tax=Actinacidiphila bryophytorum TaxID=1436133 RepID=A0A9W4ED66_9ACTN|nr:exported hypothetical protein [Actinacidiphila bryophytorum]
MYRRFAALRPSTNATPRGRAVSASAALWMVSPNSATDPDTATITAWTIAVAPRMPSDSQRVRIPSREVSTTGSTLSLASWLCGRTRCATSCRARDHQPASCTWPWSCASWRGWSWASMGPPCQLKSVAATSEKQAVTRCDGLATTQMTRLRPRPSLRLLYGLLGTTATAPLREAGALASSPAEQPPPPGRGRGERRRGQLDAVVAGDPVRAAARRQQVVLQAAQAGPVGDVERNGGVGWIGQPVRLRSQVSVVPSSRSSRTLVVPAARYGSGWPCSRASSFSDSPSR